MKVLIACEYTGIVREAFRVLGHNAWSCDLKPSLISGNHYQGNVLEILNNNWDLIIAHPPCKYLSHSSEPALYKNPSRIFDRLQAFNFFLKFTKLNCHHVCIENSYSSFISKHYRPPSQIIQPYNFGDRYQKKTCLWLKGLPPLLFSVKVYRGDFKRSLNNKPYSVWYSNNKNLRDRTFPGIASAMALQWSITINK